MQEEKYEDFKDDMDTTSLSFFEQFLQYDDEICKYSKKCVLSV